MIQKIIIIAIIMFLLLIVPFINATITCAPTSITHSYTKGESTSKTVICSNSANQTVAISKLGDYFTIDQTSLGIAPSQKTIAINFSSSVNAGLYTGTINFNDGSSSVPVYFQVIEQQTQSQGCSSIDVFPLILTNIKVVQGEKKTRNIQLSVPSCYNSSVNVQGVSLQTDSKPIQLGEINIGRIQPGNSILIPLEINADGVVTGQYSDQLQLLLYDLTGNKINVPSISISVLVSQGISPISNFSLTDLPSCSLDGIEILDGIEMNLNDTHKLTCSKPNPNIDIHPLVDQKYIKGISVDETSSQFIYSFKPILIGETMISSEFLYKMAPLGTPFQQEIRISPSGSSPVSGITLKAIFYQSDKKVSIADVRTGELRVVVVDNKTNSIISPQKILLNGKDVNNTFYVFSQDEYDLRISAAGFLDLVMNFTINRTEIPFTIIPSKEVYYVGDEINISTDINDTKTFVNDFLVTLPYKLTSSGNTTIKLVKEGYVSTNKTISILDSVSYRSISPDINSWKKGTKALIQLSKNSTWEVYRDGTKIKSGVGDIVDFDISDNGNWQIKADNKYILNKNIENNFVWYNPFTWGWAKAIGYWWIGIFGLIGIFIYFFFIRDEDKHIPMSYVRGD